MPRIVNIAEFPKPQHPSRPSEAWTAIIPAAGQGTRLGYHQPKILYPVLDKPILGWLAELLKPFIARFVVVLAPDAKAHVVPALDTWLKNRYEVVLQTAPRGMADAVWQTKEAVHSPSTLVIWGDQIALTPQTIAAAMALHDSRPHAALTFPTVWRKDPYIHFERDAEQRLTGVYQAREATTRLAEGENDCGLFLFNTERLFAVLQEAMTSGSGKGSKTGEFNLLPLLPRFDKKPDDVATLRISNSEETLGINTPEEAAVLSRILKARGA